MNCNQVLFVLIILFIVLKNILKQQKIYRDSEHLLFMKDCAKSVEKDKKNLKQRLEDLEGFLRLTINEVDSS
jgi:hypothetical protein